MVPKKKPTKKPRRKPTEWHSERMEPIQISPAPPGWQAVLAPTGIDWSELTVAQLTFFPIVAWCVYESQTIKLRDSGRGFPKIVDASITTRHPGALIVGELPSQTLMLAEAAAYEALEAGDLLTYSAPGESPDKFLKRFQRFLTDTDFAPESEDT